MAMRTKEHLTEKENWLKAVLGLTIFNNACIPSLKKHFTRWAEELNAYGDHLNHLLDLAAKGEVKHAKKSNKEYVWDVNCTNCRLILIQIEKSHIRPARLLWENNKNNFDCQKEYRLAKIYMPAGNEGSKSYSDRDVLAILEIMKSDKSFGLHSNEISNLIKFRNKLMHPSTISIKKETRDEVFANMKKLLETGQFKESVECVSAIQELDKLKEKNMMCELDESNEIWILAKAFQKEANVDVGMKIPSPESMRILLKDLQAEFQKERDQQKVIVGAIKRKAESQCSNLSNENKDLQEEINSMKRPRTSGFAGRVLAGTIAGAGVGLIWGSVGPTIGGTAGGVVGGLSMLWD